MNPITSVRHKSDFLFPALIFSGIIFFAYGSTRAQNHSKANWTVTGVFQDCFIENKGQFRMGTGEAGTEILYGVDHGGTQIYFHKNGVTFYLRQKENKKKDTEELILEAKKKQSMSAEEWMEFEREEKRAKVISDIITMRWENTNPSVKIVPSEKSEGYHSYTFKENGEDKNINDIHGYRMLTYKNLYPGIDVEYVFHPAGGIKYALILQPGADLTAVRMKYPAERNITLTADGGVHVTTKFGDIIDHPPLSFYSGNKEQTITSAFRKENNTISFVLENYNRTKTVIVDPWTQTPTLANSNCVWECERDGSGDVYIIGGDAPLKLLKYSAAGAFQWSYTTPWDTTNDGDWLGTMATDLAGYSYVTNGSIAALQKVDAGGSMIYSVNGGAMDEYWNIAFNCDQTKLIIGGTRLNGFPSITGDGVIYDINANNGSVNDMKVVGKTLTFTVLGFPVTDPNEARSITSSRNARYYYLTLDTLGAIDQDFSACPNSNTLLGINHTYSFGYKCENYRPNNGNAGICAIRANRYYVYTQNGATLHKRSLATGAILTAVAIPGGNSPSVPNTSPTLYQTGNSGIDIDSCGNVYVGSGNAVIKYDSSLNFITSAATSFAVYDVAVSYGGNIIVAGATGDNSNTSRTGYVQSINMAACSPMTLFCCNANVCPAGPFCTTDPVEVLTAATPGGTWSGTGITNPSTGTFDPLVAGPGTWTVVYTLGCGSDSISITVNVCGTLSVCEENNGNLTVSGGTSPYTWEEWTPATSTQITNSSQCTACGYTWFFGTCLDGAMPVTSCITPGGWSTFATGTTVTPPGNDTLRVTDTYGNSLQINDISALPNCSGCAMTVSASATNASCGLSNGSATASVIGGTAPLTYAWSNGQTNGVATALSGGPYTVTVTDGGGCTASASTNVNTTSNPTVSVTFNQYTCGVNNGTATATASGGSAPYSYSWSNSQTISTATGLGSGTLTVTVTDAGTCTATGSVTVTGTPSVTVSAVPVNVSCFSGNNGSATATPSGGTSPFTYNWSNAQTGSVASNLVAGTYTVTLTDASSCTGTATATVTEPAAVSVITTKTDASCGNNDGSATATATGGAGGFSYSWSTGGSGTAINNLGIGTYTVTATDANGCTGTQTATINSAGGASVSISNVTDVSCYGDNDGAVSATATGGTPPYSYSWSNGGSQSTVTGLGSGSYTVTVTDGNGCATIDSASVTEPPAIALSLTKTDATCGNNDGSAMASASGGTGSFTYVWSNAGTSSSVTGLGGGTYTVSVTDGNGCTESQPITILSIGGPSIIPSAVQNVTCSGSNDGMVTVTASGGTQPYSYLWSNLSTATLLTGLGSGTYTVTVTDANNCAAIDSTVVTEPAAVTLTMTKADASCGNSDGSATVSASGGILPYSYSWNTGGTGSAITGIPSGNYTVTVTDNNGCTETDIISVNDAGAATVSIASQNNVSCYGGSDGSITLIVTGGTPPYTYQWSNGSSQSSVTGLPAGNYLVTVTDNVGCKGYANTAITEPAVLTATMGSTDANCIGLGTASVTAAGGSGNYTYLWSNAATSATLNGLNAGTFTVTVTDANGCTIISTAIINQTGSITANIAGIDEVCAGETATLIASGGTTYWWGYNSVTNDTLNIAPAATAAYYVVASQGGCSDTAWHTVVVNPTVQVDAGKDTTVYAGESATLTGTVTGGTSPFTYDWSTGENTAGINVSPTAGTEYFITVTDSKGCTARDSVFVDILPCDAEVFVPNIFAPDCKCPDDRFRVYSDCIKSLEVRIFDRWGEKVFEIPPTDFSTLTTGSWWNGTFQDKPMDAAVYVYILKYSTINKPDEEVVVEGNVHLIR